MFRPPRKSINLAVFFVIFLCAVLITFAVTQEAEGEYEQITSEDCTTCHETSKHNTKIEEDISHSIHDGLECLDCHTDRAISPHKEDPDFVVGCEGCRACHEEESEAYQAHGREGYKECEDAPSCAACHGDHNVLPSSVKLSKTHPANLPQTCGLCHEDLNLTKKYEILIDHPIEIYESSVHGQATKGGIYVAATCNDCHSTAGTSHKILSPGNQESSTNHFNQ